MNGIRVCLPILCLVVMSCSNPAKNPDGDVDADATALDASTVDLQRPGDAAPELFLPDTSDAEALSPCGECPAGTLCYEDWDDLVACHNVAEACQQHCTSMNAKCGEIGLGSGGKAPFCDCGECGTNMQCDWQHQCCPATCQGFECGTSCDGYVCGNCDTCHLCSDHTCYLPETGSHCQTVQCLSDRMCYDGEYSGSFGCPCQTDEDCYFLCIDVIDGKVCSREGGEECPAGWEMKAASTGGPDILFMCVPQFATQCRPCKTDDDCKGAYSQAPGGAACVSQGASGSFCATPCHCTTECHVGHACFGADLDDWTVGFCLPDSEEKECHCSPEAVTNQASTTCYVENEHGSCHGLRFCAHDGLTDCDANVPQAETCNGQDDNCNGEVDEGLECPD
jgi:hypothetical protein